MTPNSKPLDEDEVRSPTHFRKGTRKHYKKRKDKEVKFTSQDVPTTGAVDKALRAMERADSIINQVEETRKKILKDRTKTEIGKKSAAFEYGEKKKSELYSVVHEAEESVRRVIRKLDEGIKEKVSNSAQNGPFAKEDRQIVRNMEDQQQRRKHIRKLIINEQYDSAEAILGAKPHHVGLSAEMQESLFKMYQQRRYGNRIQTKKFLTEMANKLGDGYTAALSNFEVLEDEDVKEAIHLRDEARAAMKQ